MRSLRSGHNRLSLGVLGDGGLDIANDLLGVGLDFPPVAGGDGGAAVEHDGCQHGGSQCIDDDEGDDCDRPDEFAQSDWHGGNALLVGVRDYAVERQV